MRSFFRALACLVALAFPLSLTGCGAGIKTEVKKPKDDHGHDHEHGHDHAHDHGALGPHEGHILELGKEEYHAEWTHDDASGKVTVYILDSEIKKEVPIEAENVTIKIKVGEKEQAHTLEAVNRTTGDKPTASQFELTDKPLSAALTTVGEGTEATLEVTIGDRPFSAKFESHAGHDHGHKH